MGIYTDKYVYGVCWNIYDISHNLVKKFEKTYPEKMNIDQIKEIENEYDKLTAIERTTAFFKFYTGYSSTYEIGTKTYMSWHPTNKCDVEDFFVNGHFCDD